VSSLTVGHDMELGDRGGPSDRSKTWENRCGSAKGRPITEKRKADGLRRSRRRSSKKRMAEVVDEGGEHKLRTEGRKAWGYLGVFARPEWGGRRARNLEV